MLNPTQQSALSTLALAAVASARKLNMPDAFAELSLAQAGLESFWGARMSGKNNIFGIIADGFHGEGSTAVATHEQGSTGLVPSTRRFQDYLSVEECFEDHARIFISGLLAPKYHAWLAAGGDLHALVAAISFPSDKPLYATDSGYAEKVGGILRMPQFQTALRLAFAIRK